MSCAWPNFGCSTGALTTSGLKWIKHSPVSASDLSHERHVWFKDCLLLLELVKLNNWEFHCRFLGSGDSQRSLSFAFHIARSSVSQVISETAQAIWDNLKDDYVRCPRTPEEWTSIARGFLHRWNVPNCIGKWLAGKYTLHGVHAPTAKAVGTIAIYCPFCQ